MKITRNQLRSIIVEERLRILTESLTKDISVQAAVENASYDITRALEEIISPALDDDAYDEMITASTRLATRIQQFVYGSIRDFEDQLR